MTTLILIGVLAATLLFWAVGAYNRLVRLRSDVVRAFSVLDPLLSVQPAVIEASLPDAGAVAWNRLRAVGAQYSTSLANARSRPLDPQAISALSAAQRVLEGVWQVANGQPEADDPVAAALLEGLHLRLLTLAEQAAGPAGFFDASVMAYNHAIRQFPALILARIWGFSPAATLGSVNAN